MRQSILALSVLLAVAFTACGKVAKEGNETEAKTAMSKQTTLQADFKALTDKSAQLQTILDNANDQDSAVKQEYDELQVEIADFLEANKEYIAKLSADEQAIFRVK